MATLTIRNLPDETQQALRELAAANRRSMEAEVRAILDAEVARRKWLSDGERAVLTPQQQDALLKLRLAFAPRPGHERSGVETFLAERRRMWGEE